MREFSAPRPARRRARPAVESIERRLLLTVYTVTTASDVDTEGQLTLRDAITLVDQDSQPDVIDFAIGTGPQSILPLSPLPVITNQVTIDGTTQPGYVGTPLITINGEDSGTTSSPGLVVGPGADGSMVQGLDIINSDGPGIAIDDADGVSLLANDIGITPAAGDIDAQLAPNNGYGVTVTFSTGDQIGAAGEGNAICGNDSGGISITGSSFEPSNESIQGNLIGTLDLPDSEIGLGKTDYGNDGDGINLTGVTASTIGGEATGAGNLISANTGNGVDVVAGSTSNLIQGNMIGTSSSGELAVGNLLDGVAIDNSPDNTIGGTAADAGNLISGNDGEGIFIDQAGSTGNLVLGNSIGLDQTGSTALANSGDGIEIVNAPGNDIGGTFSGSNNMIEHNGGDGIDIQGVGASASGIVGNQILANSGEGISITDAPSNAIINNIIGQNRLNGVAILDPSASGNLLQGNDIGTNPSGESLDNIENGVFIVNSPANTIGGTSAIARNVISGNEGDGIALEGPEATGNLAEGNYIGTDPTGTAGLGNFSDGVFILNAPANTIGGTVSGARNVLSHDLNGVYIQTETDADAGSEVYLDDGMADNNLVEGNYIGTGVTGETVLGNFNNGVVIINGSDDTIGGTTAGSGNLVSNNLTDGVSIGVSATLGGIVSTGDVVEGNIIGLDASGTRAFGNEQDGVQLDEVINATIGGTAAGAGNVISGNANGVDVAGVPGVPLGSYVEGNIIGLGADGVQLDSISPGLPALSNTSNGILLEEGAAGVTIGGTTPDARNVISGNGSVGVLFQTAASDDLVEGNLIGVAADGLTARANDESGVFIAGQSSGITIGGTTPGSANVISGNPTGVLISDPGTSDNLVDGNLIGLGLDGSTTVGNLGFGVELLDGVTGNTIGGTSFAARNVISGNGQGVGLFGPDTSGNLVAGNVVGLDSTGEVSRGNLQLGILLESASGNTIGGTAFGAGNVVSGNFGVGLELFGPTSSGNLISGNLIGLDATGTLALGNSGFGIQVVNAPDNTIGGTTPGARNTISGNRQAGVDVEGSESSYTFIEGNFIGTSALGENALGNMADGVLIDNAPLVVVGGYGASALNVISGNAANGVEVDGSGSVSDWILGNFIGTDASGLYPTLGNGQSGVDIDSAPGVVVGSTLAPFRNVISGNVADGILISGAPSIGTLVEGNYLGLAATGSSALGNGNDGVLLDGTVGVTIGGTAPGASNVISGNISSGVEFSGSTTAGDVIGTDATGTMAVGNSTGVLVNGAPYNVIGGTAPGSGNLISGNVSLGVHIEGATALNNAVEGNRIGTDVTGAMPVANAAGVFLDGAPSNLLSGNLISGNSSSDVLIDGPAASANVLIGNLIGINATGAQAVGTLNPDETGVLIIDAPGNVIGGTAPADRNVISGNGVGVDISGFDASGNSLLGNSIGTNAAGLKIVANMTGIYINGSPSNTIGGSAPGAGNLISGNTSAGVYLYGTLTTGSVVQGNLIGTNITGTAALVNSTGVFIELADSNTIGGPTSAAGNLISGNSVAGVYIFDDASDNLVQDNRIGVTATGKPLGNGQYGVLLYNAADNTVDMSKATGNLIANSGIGNYREFTGTVPTTTTSTTTTTKTTSTKSTKTSAKTVTNASHPTGPKVKAKAKAKAVSRRG
jgi:hypothetical protein